MKSTLPLFACLSSLILVAACNQGNNVQTATDHTPSAQMSIEPSPHTVFSSDKKISLDLPHANYTDELPNKEVFAKTYLEGTKAEKLTLIQTDPNTGTIIYAENQGTPNNNFSQIENNLRKNTTINELNINTSINNQISYQFSHQEGENTVRDSCIIQQTAERILICATNTNSDFDSLNHIIKSVKIHSTTES